MIVRRNSSGIREKKTRRPTFAIRPRTVPELTVAPAISVVTSSSTRSKRWTNLAAVQSPSFSLSILPEDDGVDQRSLVGRPDYFRQYHFRDEQSDGQVLVFVPGNAVRGWKARFFPTLRRSRLGCQHQCRRRPVLVLEVVGLEHAHDPDVNPRRYENVDGHLNRIART